MTYERSVVIVEDDFLIAEYLQGVCNQLGVPVLGREGRADAAIAVIRRERPTHVLMDVRLPGRRDGVDIALALYREFPDMRFVFITGSNEPETIDRINDDHPYRILIKPIDPEDLREALS